MSFVQRQITVTFSLANGNFQGGGNTKTISAADATDINAPRISAHIDNAGGPSGSAMTMAIYGMPLADMNQLSTVGRQLDHISKNQVTVMAGDANAGLSLVFSGIIFFSFVDAQAQPNVALRFTARPGALADAQTAASTSINGQADLAAIMQGLASQGGFGFEGNGVNVKITRPYLWGSVGAQIRQLARAGGVEYIIDRGTLAIWQPGSVRGIAPVTISPETGLVGYPAFNQAQIFLKSIFNSQLQNGGKVTVQSSLTPANGDWTVVSVQHEIEANVIRGKWFSHIRAAGIMTRDTP